MIVVTGATGQLGSAVVQRLLQRVPAADIGVSVREPDKANELRDQGVRVRRGDFDDAASLADAFHGAAQVLLVSVDRSGESAVRQHLAAVEAAATAGVGRILYTSHAGANPASAFAPMVDHAATEAALRDSGVPFTSLRNGFYATSALQQLGDAVHTGELAAPADGPVAWTAHADLAAAAAIVLAEGGFDGATPALTGAEAVDLAGVAAIASELSGRPIRRVVVPDEQFRAGLLSRGVPESAAQMFLGLYVASRRGEFAEVDPTLGRLLGRPPIPVRDVLAQAIAAAR